LLIVVSCCDALIYEMLGARMLPPQNSCPGCRLSGDISSITTRVGAIIWIAILSLYIERIVPG